jgi:hypothetical protein
LHAACRLPQKWMTCSAQNRARIFSLLPLPLTPPLTPSISHFLTRPIPGYYLMNQPPPRTPGLPLLPFYFGSRKNCRQGLSKNRLLREPDFLIMSAQSALWGSLFQCHIFFFWILLHGVSGPQGGPLFLSMYPFPEFIY